MREMFKVNIQSVSIMAEPSKVYEFVSDAEKLPIWAPAFASSVRRGEEGRVFIKQGDGEAELKILSDAKTGVVDFQTRVEGDEWSSVRSRVTPNGLGSEYLFVLFQFPGISDAMFDGMTTGMGHELQVLKKHLEC